MLLVVAVGAESDDNSRAPRGLPPSPATHPHPSTGKCTTANSSLFTSKEQDTLYRRMWLLKLAMALYTGPVDLITVLLPRLHALFGRLLRVDGFRGPVYLCYRVLLGRIPVARLDGLWPVVLQDLLQTAPLGPAANYEQCRMLYFLSQLEDGVFQW